jgi:hypothetical protein
MASSVWVRVELAMAYLKHYPGICLQEPGKPLKDLSGRLVFWAKFKPGTSQIQERRVTATANMLSDTGNASKIWATEPQNNENLTWDIENRCDHEEYYLLGYIAM